MKRQVVNTINRVINPSRRKKKISGPENERNRTAMLPSSDAFPTTLQVCTNSYPAFVKVLAQENTHDQ